MRSSSFRRSRARGSMNGWTGWRRGATRHELTGTRAHITTMTRIILTAVITTRVIMPDLFIPLAVAAITLASVHALAPDHWLPLAALARAQQWTALRTAQVTAACGFAHVTVSVILGAVGLGFGIRIYERWGAEFESVAGVILIGFGLVYGWCGLRHAAAHLHGHAHRRYDHIHEPR